MEMPVPKDVYMRALRRAALGLGSVEALRAHLGVQMSDLCGWMEGEKPPPTTIFLRVVDLLADEELAVIKQGMHGQSATG